jgi:hypothetical protein
MKPAITTLALVIFLAGGTVCAQEAAAELSHRYPV